MEEGVAGYATPKVAVGAVVGNDDGQILLIQRADSGIWLYPTGWADIGYSASEVAVKEVREETGIEVEVRSLIGLFDGLRLGFGPTPLYSLVFHCHAIGGELKPHPLEVLDVGWFDPDDLPEPLARGQPLGEHAMAAIRGEQVSVMYDLPRTECGPPTRRPERPSNGHCSRRKRSTSFTSSSSDSTAVSSRSWVSSRWAT